MARSEVSRGLRKAMRTLLPRSASTQPRQHNMSEHEGEHYYFEQYMTVLSPLVRDKQRVLDVGCQYGRFLIPLTKQGHEVVGTDTDAHCLAYIRERYPAVELRQEAATDTAGRLGDIGFDLVLCLELLYQLPNWKQVLTGLGRQITVGGTMAGSHRSQGYYIHRFLRERRYDELDLLLAGRHPSVNAQSADELRAAYRAAGLEVASVTAIGAFSGTEVDPFAAVSDPADIGRRARQQLMRYESDSALTDRYMNSARYLLVVASRG